VALDCRRNRPDLHLDLHLHLHLHPRKKPRLGNSALRAYTWTPRSSIRSPARYAIAVRPIFVIASHSLMPFHPSATRATVRSSSSHA
jgi:hypothetical protein